MCSKCNTPCEIKVVKGVTNCGHPHTLVPHKHAAVIKAWADGAVIQCYANKGGIGICDWHDDIQPQFHTWARYRIKPEPKPDVVQYFQAIKTPVKMGYGDAQRTGYASFCSSTKNGVDNVKVIFDGETGTLKSAEKI